MWTQLFLHQIKIFWNIQQFISKIKNQKVDGKDFYVVAHQSVVLLIFNVRVLFKNNLDIIQDTSPPVLVHLRHLFFPHKHFLLKISNNIFTWEWLMTLPWYKTKYKNLKVDVYLCIWRISVWKPNIVRVVAGTETEENKKDLWKMILEVYGALRKCYASYAFIEFISIKNKIQFIKSLNFW